MWIALPKDSLARKGALDWLNAEGIRHLRLFEVMEINAHEDAAPFRAWLLAQDR
ncbi:hypothetical protein BH09PSE1_BH09PSE1_23170 [soil metagenome]